MKNNTKIIIKEGNVYSGTYKESNWFIEEEYLVKDEPITAKGMPNTIWGPTTIGRDSKNLIISNGEYKDSYVHRLVYAYENGGLSTIEGRQIKRINGVKADCRLDNLELVKRTYSYKPKTVKNTVGGLTGDFINQLMKSQYQ